MHVLITGITGQDGGYLTESLMKLGHRVSGMVRTYNEKTNHLKYLHPGLSLHLGNLVDEASLRKVIQDCEPHVIFNLAGISSVSESWKSPVAFADVTALGTSRILTATKSYQEETGKAIKFVQASSAEVFGQTEELLSEDSPRNPISPYGAAKAYADNLVRIHRANGMFALSLILFNHESPNRPENFVSRKISKTVAKIALGLENELTLGNETVGRDWGWAPDFVEAMIRASQISTPNDYVIATGVSHTILEFALAAFDYVGISNGMERIRLDESLKRSLDPSVLVGDSTKAKVELGWLPSKTFHEIVALMVEKDLARIHEQQQSST